MQSSHYQLPLRMNPRLASQLQIISTQTGLSKSRLCRLGLSRVITDLLQKKHLTLPEFASRYNEIL